MNSYLLTALILVILAPAAMWSWRATLRQQNEKLRTNWVREIYRDKIASDPMALAVFHGLACIGGGIVFHGILTSTFLI